jgi:hypothetical protein
MRLNRFSQKPSAGSDFSDALRGADRKMYPKKHNPVPVF